MESYVQYIEQYLNQLDQQYHEYTNELNKQAELCPMKLKPLESLDQQLKEFVQLQRKRYIEKLNTRLTRYKDYILENQFYQTILNHVPTEEQVNSFLFALFSIVDFY